MTLSNTGSTDLALIVDGATSHSAWRVELPNEPVTVPAGETVEVPLVVRVPADAWLDVPVRVTVRARDDGGAQATAFVELTPRQGVAPVSPEQVWAVPSELLGGLDVASAALGGQPTTQHFHEADIHDGLAIAGLGLGGSVQNGPDTIGVDLAGDEPVPVAGTIIDPLAGDSPFAARPRAFALLLSQDGVTYDEVLTAELGPQTEDQAFVLPEPVPARFAQLRIDSTWGDTPAQVNLGEWKVVATPGIAPATGDLDIADLVRGGHLVWDEPAWQSSVFELLTQNDTNVSAQNLEAGERQTWVVGFHQDRAAQITRLEWVPQAGSVPEQSFTSVDVAVAVDSPLGPWQSLGTWALQRAADGSVSPYTLPEPTWGRFLRLDALGSADSAGSWQMPGAIRVFERPTDETYRSILGEWGQSSPRGIYELLVPPPTFETASVAADVGDTPDEAATLEPDASADGEVARSKDVDWYALTVPEGQNTLRLTLQTEREHDVKLRLVDGSGAEVELQEAGRSSEPPTATFAAIVEPGSYRLEVVQPVLSVIVTFDTSASIFPWFPRLRAAVRAFADDVTPGQEAVQIFPFQEKDLLASWSDQAYLIGGALDGWVSEGGSSYLWDSIRRGADELAERDGMRAILALGDAVGGGFEAQGGIPVERLEQVRPAIFPVHLGGTDDPRSRPTSCRTLRPPVRASTSTRPPGRSSSVPSTAWPPGSDGRLHTLSRTGPRRSTIRRHRSPWCPRRERPCRSVQAWASSWCWTRQGACIKRLGGATRIAVAKDALTGLVQSTLPEGLPVALRTFKAGKRSCDSTLLVGLEPLERAAMSRLIERLKINKGTRTPHHRGHPGGGGG